MIDPPAYLTNERARRVFETLAKRIDAQPEDEAGLALIAHACARNDDDSAALMRTCDEFFLTRRSARK